MLPILRQSNFFRPCQLWRLLRQNLLTLILGFVVSLGLLSTPVSAQSVDDSLPAGTQKIFLPLITNKDPLATTQQIATHLATVSNPSAYAGTVTNQNSPVSNANVHLDYFDGQAWSTFTTTTDNNGQYIFYNLPTLSNGQLFYVYWNNAENDAGKLSAWACWPVTINTLSFEDFRCNFDLSGVELGTPSAGATGALPATFTWQPRAITTDVYEFNLIDPSDLSAWWWTDPALGYSNTYTLDTLPADFSWDRPYGWFVWLYGPDGYGLSYYYYQITFSTMMSAAAATVDSQPMPTNQLLSVESSDAQVTAAWRAQATAGTAETALAIPPQTEVNLAHLDAVAEVTATGSLSTNAGLTNLFSAEIHNVSAAGTQGATESANVIAVIRGGVVDPSFIQQLINRPERSSSTSINLLQRMHNGAELVFYDDGTFAFVPAGIGTIVRADLFPARGTWQALSNGVIQINASNGAGVGVNAANRFNLNGAIVQAQDGSFWAYIGEETSVVMAAVINGSNFGSNSYKYVEFWLPLQ